MLLGGIGVMFAVYGRWSQKIGWHGVETSTLSFRQPGEVVLTPSQRATIWFFAVVTVLFSAQTLVGAAAEHYRADLVVVLRPRSGPRCCPITWPAPGMCSWRCSGPRQRSWPVASF